MSEAQRMPVLFVGHGSPLNAIVDNRWSRGFRALADGLPRPKAILCISAHWYGEGTLVSANAQPRTIHDFGGFPPELHAVEYPAPGDPELARRVCERLVRVAPSERWGLDHGTWSVLKWMYPDASVPVLQLSIDAKLWPWQHHELARPLRSLRDEGVLVIGSGNVTHDLADAFGRAQRGDTTTPDWAERFDATVVATLGERDTKRLLSLWPDTEDGRRAHPTPDHWLPLVYAYAASDDDDTVASPIEGFDLGSLSMRAFRFG